MGLLLELLGYVGFLGIGHIWAGKTTRGVALLIGYWMSFHRFGGLDHLPRGLRDAPRYSLYSPRLRLLSQE